jgi:hypothetical protein
LMNVKITFLNPLKVCLLKLVNTNYELC